MSTMKKIAALIMALAMCFALAMPAFASEGGDANTGSITISNATKDTDYKAYKIFDAVYNADTDSVTYFVGAGAVKDAAAEADSPFNVAANADSKGNFTVALKDGKSAEDVKAWISNHQNIFTEATSVKADGTAVEWEHLSYGYYYITSSLGAIITLTSNTPDVQVFDKNDKGPTPTDENEGMLKQVVDAEGNIIQESDRTAQIGDTMSFRVEFNATNYITKNEKSNQVGTYVVTDTPDGFTLNNDFKVTVDGVELVKDTDYTISDDLTTLTLTWANKKGNDYETIYKSPAVVKITYTGVVNEAAADGTATNDVVVNPKWVDGTTDPDPDPIPEPAPDEPDVTVKTYNINLLKYDGSDNNKAPLSGAEFRLFDTEANGGAEIAVVKMDDGSYRVAKDGETGVVIEAGQVVIHGLSGKKTYELQEVKAPDGYNAMVGNQAVAMANTDQDCEVANNKGGVLPSTGGIGTTIFYVVGGAMVVGAGVLLITKKRMAE